MREIRLMTEIAYNMHHLLAAKESFERAHPDVRATIRMLHRNSD